MIDLHWSIYDYMSLSIGIGTISYIVLIKQLSVNPESPYHLQSYKKNNKTPSKFCVNSMRIQPKFDPNSACKLSPWYVAL